jgi:hypothetical protein
LLKVIDERDLLPGFEQRCEGLALAVTDLKRKQAVLLQRCEGLGNEAAVEVEAVGTGEEGRRGLIIADLGMEAGAVGFRYVGRVAHDDVEVLGALAKG